MALNYDQDATIKDGIKSLVNATQKSFIQEQEHNSWTYEKTLTNSRRERKMNDVKLGERLSFEYTTSDGEPIGVTDFGFLPIPAMKEQLAGKDLTVKDVMMTLLDDRSFVISSILTGRQYLWYDIGDDHVEADDTIVDLELSTEANQQFLIILTKKGKMIIYHYTIIESVPSL